MTDTTQTDVDETATGETETVDDGHFRFTAGGKQHRLPEPTIKVFTPAFFKKHFDKTKPEVFNLVFDLIASQVEHDAFEEMTWTEYRQLGEDFDKHIDKVMGATLGE